MRHVPSKRPWMYAWAPMNTRLPISNVSQWRKPTPTPTCRPSPTWRAAARNSTRRIIASNQPSPCENRPYSSASRFGSSAARSAAASSTSCGGSGSGSGRRCIALLTRPPSAIGAYLPGTDRRCMRDNGRRDARDLLVGQLRVDRQRQHFVGRLLGVREVSPAIAELCPGLLQVYRNRVVNARLDTRLLQRPLRGRPIGDADGIDVINVPRVRHFLRQRHAGRLELLAVGRRHAPAPLGPRVE